MDFIKSKRELCHPITFPMSAPTADGGAAAVVCSEEFVKRHNLQVTTGFYVGWKEIMITI